MPNETIDTTADNTIGNNSNDKTVNDHQWELEEKKKSKQNKINFRLWTRKGNY